MDKRRATLAVLVVAIFMLTIIAPTITQQSTLTALPPQQTITTNKETSTPPQDVPPWWNPTFKYRIQVNVNSTVYAVIPVDVYVNFAELGSSCHRDSIRIQYWNGTSWLPGNGLPYQVWNDTGNETHVLSATITFYANVTAYQTTTYYIYFNDEDVEPPSFTPQITATETADSIILTSNKYTAYIYKRDNGGKIFECYNTFYRGNWSIAPFNDNPMFASGKNDKFKWTIDGAPFDGPSVNYTSGPLFVTVTTCANFTRQPRGGVTGNYVNVTYRFFEWGWMSETNTSFAESLDLNYYMCCGYSFDPLLMDKLVYEGGSEPLTMTIRSEPYLLGEVSWFCTLSEALGVAAGIVDVTPLQYNITSPPLLRWQFAVSYGSSSERVYRRTATSLTVNSGNWICEHYAFYIWNGSQGYSPFVSFAKALRGSTVTYGALEERFFNLTVHVKDLDGNALANAIVEIRGAATENPLLNGATNQDGDVSFYLYEGNYNITVVWNEEHEGTSKTYRHSENYSVDSSTYKEMQLPIVGLSCHVVYEDGEDAAYVNVSVFSGNELFLSGFTNSTGWITFHLPVDEYNVSVFERMLINSTTVNLNDGTRQVEVVYPLGEQTTRTVLTVINGTSVNVVWGPGQLILKVSWTTFDGNGITPEDGRYAQYRINYGEWLDLTHEGNGIYVANLTGLLFGGETYFVEFKAGGSGLKPASSFVLVTVNPVQLNESMVSVGGVSRIIWNESDIEMWVNVWDCVNGFPVTGANVTWSIAGYGSGSLSHSGDGNYTGIISKDLLPPGYYQVRFSVDCDNYTRYTTYWTLAVSPRPLSLSYRPTYTVVFGDTLELYVYCKDDLTGSPLPSVVSVFYSIQGTGFIGVLEDGDQDGNYTGTFDTSLLTSGESYSIAITAQLKNYTSVEKTIYLYVQPIPMSIQSVQISETYWMDTLNLTVTLWDTHNNAAVTDAVVECTILKDGSVILTESLTSLGDGTYKLSIDTLGSNMLPGKYTVVINASKENYQAQPVQAEFIITPIPTTITTTSNIILGGATPYLVLLGGYGEVENSVPFVVLVFEYRDADGNPIHGATVTANGIPLTYIGDGRYMLVIPTGTGSFTMPIVVEASAENYELSQTFQVLNFKERSVAIPGINVRIPLTMFLLMSLAVVAPPASLAGYVYVKRMRIPPVIRRIDELIKAIQRGAKVEVKKPLTRDDVILSILWEEMAFIGVEPRIATMPVEVVDKLVPLLVESGLSSEEAVAVLRELRASEPADRERLLASIGVPPDVSVAILSELEKQEEKEEAKKVEEITEEAEEKEAEERGEEDMKRKEKPKKKTKKRGRVVEKRDG